jgi:hypothetical protein
MSRKIKANEVLETSKSLEHEQELNSKVEEALLKAALGYEYEETEIIATKDGKTSRVKKIKKVVPPDTTAIIFWLKTRKPSKWRTRLIADDETL